MEPPALCLLCGSRRIRQAPRAICPDCRKRAPEGVWSGDDIHGPEDPILKALKILTVALGLFALAAWLILSTVRARPVGFSGLLWILFSLLLVFIAGLVVLRAGEVAFERTGKFRSLDGTVEAEVRLYAGSLRWAVCRCFAPYPLDLGAAPGARALTSARAHRHLPALRGAITAKSLFGPWSTAGDDTVVGAVAILGMAARGEIDLLAGAVSGFSYEKGSVRRRTSAQTQHRLWLRASREAAPDHPFERHLVEHLLAFTPGAPRSPEAPPGDYRRGPAQARGEGVLLADVLERYASTSALIGQRMRGDLRCGSTAAEVAEDDLVAALVSATRVDREAMQELMTRVGEHVGAPAAVRLSPVRPVRELLASGDLGEIPEALRPAAPRPDVFSGKGYLSQERYRDQYLPLLIHGRVARAVCIAYQASGDADGRDVTFSYVWLDDRGQLQSRHGKESFDPMHAGLSIGEGSICVDMDAGMGEGRVVTVVYDGRAHVIYEALRVGA